MAFSLLSRVWKPVAAACVSVGLLAGCGADDGAAEEGSADVVQISDGVEVSVSPETDAKPVVSVPSGEEPPKALFTFDVVEGSGTEAKAGDSVAVQYAGFNWSNGKEFDASWNRGAQPFSVSPLGSAPVIQGWNDGLVGAQVGDRRLIVIPPELGYGAQGAGGVIGPNETLVFVVDVVSINGKS
ncbi:MULTISPECIES: FKBP-type peptidyl-prolyl cis-trans isomerase [Glycomyces]|jgi:peptidylprolyl isomerase|uniref:Peptidyl-prolyl cis-trans isomerase n=2 Tax=Glycomyces TaxID=58113 RepID=A0A9X3PPS0_9ACTN|nr:FKBP-type peptidyl-prolyl cis-trans isomerase [Glycomyces lechevalierae]MDA1386977.1 FKBP-type peptidyl-prolyl cis-trans isomerase [Glycomyces lechevalierae]MDR7341549.1 peptidylprolyl isomerase [Glycomyces lechevalierae]